MKRKILTTALLFTAVFSLIGCSGKQEFDVSEKKDTTKITIPGDLNPSETLPKALLDAGFTESEKESDGSVTYSIPTDIYDKFLDDMKNSIDEYVDKANGGEYETITSIKINEDYDTITVTINAQEYENSTNELVVNALALKVLHYNAYSGEKISVKIKYIDVDSENVYDVVTIEQ